MNTVKSFWVGWGSLCVAGGGAYYFAKKSINADRQARFEADQKKRALQQSLEYSTSHSTAAKSNEGPPRADHSGSPSSEATLDPAPTRHAPDSEGQRVQEKSKYETSQPFRSRKGDRFS
ncbi:hypothetical protein PZA11_005478 [Diplocarpon coronariae]|uniref:Uncharacterized protein n=1 Tax=Diplocarpon coronariae TaxID=2795749 RepID=A0A218ZEV3_9HELO|nr:hypothetical protein JHW43_000214 [Diplocarpon mali]OWP06621.1 hypothetical protein B2J93_5100 [Marssonina coronariae]